MIPQSRLSIFGDTPAATADVSVRVVFPTPQAIKDNFLPPPSRDGGGTMMLSTPEFYPFIYHLPPFPHLN